MIEDIIARPAPAQRWRYLDYIFTALITGAVSLVVLGLEDGKPDLLVLIVPILLSASLWGRGPGLVATALAAGSSGVVMVLGRPPAVIGPITWTTLVLSGVLVSVWSGQLHRLQRRVAAEGRRLVESEIVIEERNRASAALLSSQQRYRDLVTLCPSGIVINRGGRIAFANPAAVALLGAAEESDVLGLPVERMVNASGQPTEVPLDGLDGIQRTIEVVARPFTDLEGPAVLVVISDLTDRKKAETANREWEQRTAAIIGSALSGIVTIDASHRIEMVNPAAERMFGLPEVELLGTFLPLLIPAAAEASVESADNIISVVDASGRPRDNPRTLIGRRASGELFPLEAAISASEVGGRRLITLVMRDLTLRLKAEQALREEQERFQQLSDAIHEVFWLTEPDRQRVVFVSHAFETIWGRSCQSLYDDPTVWMAAVHPNDRERIQLAAATGQANGEYDEEYRVVRPDGSVRWIHDRAVPVRDGDGRVVRIAGVAEDVTGRRALEEQLRQTQKMECIGQLAGGVAHDFNNLLTVIIAGAEEAGGELESLGRSQEMVQEILHASRRATALTRQLLAFTRQEVIEPRVLNLAEVVSDTERMLRRLISEDVQLTTILEPTPSPVRVDPGQWSQVLINLAVNARDAMPGGGRLTIEVRQRSVDERFRVDHPTVPLGQHVLLSVTDTGTGMSADLQTRIFEPFFTTKGRGQGTGLGLAVVYGIVQQSGAVIEVSSAPGAGTTFNIYLPLVTGPLPVPSVVGESRPGGGHESILLVEDHTAVRRLAKRVLTGAGYRLREAADGREALALLAQPDNQFDLLLTDVVMPDLGGPELVQAIPPGQAHMKVLYTSGYLDDALIRRGVLAAEVAFLQKPYAPAALLQRVREVLDGI